MTTLLVTHPSGLAHSMGPGHPERPDRLRAIERALAGQDFEALVRRQAPRVADEMIAFCHSPGHREFLARLSPASGLAPIDADTAMGPETFEAALRAAGGAVFAVEAVMDGRASNAFVAMRPPGHHAERDRAMGFCFLNNAAIAARAAQRRFGAERVAIVDFDVHHGNGTQDIFWSDPSVLYASTHQFPLYPGTGAAGERGACDTIVNAPLPAGATGEALREAFEKIILPRVDAFQPNLVIVSAGFDAHWRDPLAQLRLTEDDFAWATRRLMDCAAKSAQGRLVSVLEGGYDLDALALSAAAHVRTLMDAR